MQVDIYWSNTSENTALSNRRYEAPTQWTTAQPRKQSSLKTANYTQSKFAWQYFYVTKCIQTWKAFNLPNLFIILAQQKMEFQIE